MCYAGIIIMSVLKSIYDCISYSTCKSFISGAKIMTTAVPDCYFCIFVVIRIRQYISVRVVNLIVEQSSLIFYRVFA